MELSQVFTQLSRHTQALSLSATISASNLNPFRLDSSPERPVSAAIDVIRSICQHEFLQMLPEQQSANLVGVCISFCNLLRNLAPDGGNPVQIL